MSLLRVNPPLSLRYQLFGLTGSQLVPFPLHPRVASPVPLMSPSKAPAVLMPDSESTIKSVYVDLIPCDSPTHGFQNRRELFTTRRRAVYFRSASLLTPDRCSLSGFLPFYPNRWVPAPWKGSTVGRIGYTSDKALSERPVHHFLLLLSFFCETSVYTVL